MSSSGSKVYGSALYIIHIPVFYFLSDRLQIRKSSKGAENEPNSLVFVVVVEKKCFKT